MSRARAELSRDEGRVLQDILIGETRDELRLVAMLRSGRLMQALRTDTGPLLETASTLLVRQPRELRELEEAKGIDRVVTVDLDRAGAEFQERLWECVLDGSVRSDPPWVPILDRLQHLRPGLRARLAALLPDGTYALRIERDEDSAVVICARIRRGGPSLLLGAESLALEDSRPDPVTLLAALARVGPPRLLVHGSVRDLRAVLSSPHPATALERASIRGEIRCDSVHWRVSLGLFLARVIGL